MFSSLDLRVSNSLHTCTFRQLKEIHALIITSCLYHDIQILSKFLRRSTEYGSMVYPNMIFAQSATPCDTQITLWNAMIRGYAYNGPFETCVSMFDEMFRRGLRPNNFTYPYVLNSCSQLGRYDIGKKVHCHIIKSGFECSLSVSESLISMYMGMSESIDSGGGQTEPLSDARKVFDKMCAKPVELWNKMISGCVNLGDIDYARQLFGVMPHRDVVSWNSMISGFVKVGNVAEARELFEKMPVKNVVSRTSMIGAYASVGDLKNAREVFEDMPDRNVVSWNSMISAYVQQGEFKQGLYLFVQMHSEGVEPDGFTLVSVLTACSHLGDMEFGRWITTLIRDWSQMGVQVGTALVEMYAKCGDVDRAFAIFFKMGKKDVFCWNVMIKSLAIHGITEDAIKLFFSMQDDGLKPNGFTFSSVLFACSHGGLIEEGERIFHSMERDFRISPKLAHYGCYVDLLCRNGQLEKAFYVVTNMPFKPDIAVWGALLEGCKLRGDFKLAEEVMQRARELGMEGSGVFVSLFNMHASMGHWQEALNTRQKMEEHKIRKQTGYSCVI